MVETAEIAAIIKGKKIEILIMNQKKLINDKIKVLITGYVKSIPNITEEYIIPTVMYELCGKFIPASTLDVSFWEEKINANREQCSKLNDILGKMTDQQSNIQQEYMVCYNRVNNNNQ